ncbi:TetR family transcriptional regulator [Sphaerisporangium rufum]|uniref:TetR family transcriptional regulator n=1 Tax=Sphaerisporangium rufum TaxID=1381558 RepID=A0A919QYD3_9ACTN|nr:TetR/AcrR family transcriptional regulator [Sphaerisporangium rufum]GII75085.1 TetR family transcriptional regulator [Sphaerisporangium rufum]
MGLRERKKHRTRATLVDAAYELFLRQGYEATTVEQIAAAADISPRTLFRYFKTKEDLALDFLAEHEELVFAALAARPDDEPAFDALIEALRAFVRTATSGPPEEIARFLSERRLMDTTPALATAGFRRLLETERRLTAEIARRLGVDPDTDRRPELLVAFATSALRVGLNRPGAAPRDLAALIADVDATLTLAQEALRRDRDR